MSISISVHSTLGDLTGWAQRLQRDQMPFATALALTLTAKDAEGELTRAMPQYLDKPTPFSMKAWTTSRATKGSLVARVFAKDAQAKYLRWQIDGGERAPTRKALKLPTAIALDQFGNIPKRDLAKLIQLAKQGKRLTRVRGARLGISTAIDLFYGAPDDGRPAGIYKRVQQGSVHHLIPLVVFPRKAAHYKPRLPMASIVGRAVRGRFAANFATAWSRAVGSAR